MTTIILTTIIHNVLPNAQNASSAGKWTWPGVHQPNGPQFNMAIRVTSEQTYAHNAWARIRAVHVIGLLHTGDVWHTSQSPHAIWCSPTCPHSDWRMVGCVAFERWVRANEISIFSYVEISASLTYRNGGVTRIQILLRNDLGTAFCMSPSAAEISLQMSSVWDFKACVSVKESPQNCLRLDYWPWKYNIRLIS